MIVLEDFPGSETRVQRQCLSLLNAGHEVRIFAASGKHEETDWHGARVERSIMPRKKAGSRTRRTVEYVVFPFEAFLWSLKAALGWRPDVVQVASMPDWLVCAAMPAKWFAAARVILDLHDPMPELLTAKGGTARSRRFLELLEGWSARLADNIIVPTLPMAACLRERHAGVDPIYIPNAVDGRIFGGAPKRASAKTDVVTLGYHGTLGHRFGVHVVLRALRLLLDDGLRVRLSVCGDGDRAAELKGLSDGLRLSDHVVFHGQVAAESLPTYIDEFTFGTVPYEDSEFMRLAYSTKAFEYAIRGVPILMADIPSLRDQMTPEAAFFFDAGSPDALAATIKSALQEPERVKKKVEAARRRIESFTWDLWQRPYLEVLDRGFSAASVSES